MYKELEAKGFDISRIEIECPLIKKDYGELIEFEIRYRLVLKTPTISGGKYATKEQETILTVRKNSFSKI